MAGRLYVLGRWAARHRGRVLGIWLLLVAVVGGLGITLQGAFTTEFAVPGIESQQAQDLLKAKFPAAAGGVARVVFAAPAGTTLAGHKDQAAIAASLKGAASVPGVVAVADPAATGAVSRDRTISYADVHFRQIPDDVTQPARDALSKAMAPARSAGIQVEFGGTAETPKPQVGGPSEVVGVVVAFIVLAVAIGSVLAAGLPLLTALIGVAIGVLGVEFVARFVQMTNTATVLALMIGLAVGIDYALFIVSRHREQLAEPGARVEDSIGRATGTAGSAVVFAGTTVIVALAALAATGIPFLTVMGLAAAATVLLAVLVAITLVPALLALAGERLRPSPGGRAVRRTQGTWSLAWARGITRAPVAVLLVSVIGLGALALPARHLRLGLPSNETQPVASTQHRGYELLTRGFGAGFNATLTVVVQDAGVPAPRRAALVENLRAELARDSDIATVTPSVVNSDGTVAVLNVVPRTGPDDNATVDLVHRMRDHDKPVVARAGGAMFVTGVTAAAIDISAKLSGALPVFLAIIVVLAVILLALAFRSLVVPLKAIVGFLLSTAASVGVVVWVFQEDHLSGVFQVAAAAPIVSFLPVLLIGVLFGLSMDYEVFLVSRMREYYEHTGDAAGAVTQGVARSGRVVSAAALIMASVFGSFIFDGDPIIKSIGFALAIGVLFDAFVVRMTIVPAVMALLGQHAWRLPRWLDRLLPHVDIEGTSLPAAPTAPDTGSRQEVPLPQ